MDDTQHQTPAEVHGPTLVEVACAAVAVGAATLATAIPRTELDSASWSTVGPLAFPLALAAWFGVAFAICSVRSAGARDGFSAAVGAFGAALMFFVVATLTHDVVVALT